MATCLVLMLGAQGYFVYKLASLWMPKTAGLYKNTKITMAVFSVFSVLIFAITFINGCICINNFGRGLKAAHADPEKNVGLGFGGKLKSPIDGPRDEVAYNKLVIE
ncbi:hypothetical protein Q8F55_000517 [Vanrija albida]|uniref:Uncharacterized protein n=1 Tax=Vanrija albida TaxID=181172 RepID=A0ABR3QDH2_9TREE